jgi:hypothetical protein
MNDKKIPASLESRNALYENMGTTIESFSPILKGNIILSEILKEKLENNAYKIFDAFLSLNIYVQYTNIELASVLRACFRANLPAEKRYNIKWINCVILESYKHLYGYGSAKKKSLWISKVKPLLKVIKHQEFGQNLENLENQIIEFGESDITNLEQRNLSFHYDLEPLLVYDMLIGLSEEEEVQRMICFMDLLQNISFFVSKYINEHAVLMNIEPKALLKYAFTFSDFDIFQNNRDNIHSTMESAIQSHAQRLDTFIRQQSLPELIKQKFKDINSDSINPIYRLIEIQKTAIQLTYLYIDLASATKAFISSEYTIEKQLSLKQINIIIYEGYNKLYGLNGESEDSFWQKYICPIALENEDDSISDEFNSINQELQTLKEKVETFDKQRQLSVHLDKGIPKVYSMLHNLNPVKEMQKALLLLNILPKILNLLTKCLHIIDLRSRTNHEKRMASTYETIDNIINLMKKMPNTQQKEDLMKMLGKFKTGEFFDEILRRTRR